MNSVRMRSFNLSLSARVMLVAVALVALCAVALVYLIVGKEREAYLADVSTALTNRAQSSATQLGLRIDDMRRDALILAHVPPVQGIVRATRDRGLDKEAGVPIAFWMAGLTEIFSAFAKSSPEYFQIRFLGVAADGRELVRVDSNNGRPTVTPPGQLQSKGGRDYFQAAAKLKAGEVYLSEINLNREHGKVEVPHVRTLRAATPVFAPDGDLFGVVVINMNIGPAIDAISADAMPGVRGYLANANGDYLSHPDPSRTFGFDLGKRYTLQQDMPRLHLPSSSGVAGAPLQTVSDRNTVMRVAVARLRFDPQAPERFLFLAYALPNAAVEARLARVRNTIAASVAGIAFLLLGLVVLGVRRAFAPLTHLTTLAERIGAGQYDVALPAAGVGELGSLVRAFRGMLDGIGVREQKIQGALTRAEALLESAPDPVVIVDRKGRIAVVNARVEAVFGYPRAELLGQPVEMLIPERLHAAHVKQRSAYQEDPHARAMGAGQDLYARRKDGSEFAVDVSLSPLATPEGTLIISTVRDVTERKRAEAKIRGQLEHLGLLDRITRSIGERLDLKSTFQVVVRTLEDSLPVDFGCVCLHDAAGNALTVTSVGAKSEALAHELAMGEQASIGVDENGLSRCMQGQLVYEPDIGQARFPFPERLARGGLRSVVLAPLKSESRVFGVLVVARRAANAFESVECEFLRQLSEHVALAAHQAQLYGSLQQAYDELRQTQEAAMQEERLRALGQMASGIAHDINNALSPVSLYTESMLETEKNLSERARGYLETIQRAVEDVAHTVARMREFYRQREQQLELAPVELNRMVQQVLELTKARWGDMAQQRGVTIRVVPELAPELPKIMGVESEIREALTNLVFNAVDAMPEGGTLTLRTRLAGAEPGQSVAVEVADSGVGMDEQTRRKCLEPFFTTKGERGTGLGLAMVFGMVQRHSCALEIDSAPGAGTTMRLVFAVPTAAIAEPGRPAQALKVPSRLRLLLVDDDPVLLKSLRDALETDGHKVATANGGEAGIGEFRASIERGETYAAVFTDLGMPYVDGRKVAAAVKEASPATPVILLTGWGQRMVAEGDIPPHVDRVLAKPPKLREVRETLAQLCGNAAN